MNRQAWTAGRGISGWRWLVTVSEASAPCGCATCCTTVNPEMGLPLAFVEHLKIVLRKVAYRTFL